MKCTNNCNSATRKWYVGTLCLCIVYGVMNIMVNIDVVRLNNVVSNDNGSVRENKLSNSSQQSKSSSITCDFYSPELEEIVFSNGLWQVPLNSSAYLYSAYMDIRDRKKPVIRVIGMAEQSGTLEPFYCQIWYDLEEPSDVTEATIEEMWLEWDVKGNQPYYRPYLFSCPLSVPFEELKSLPTHVSLTGEPCELASSLLPVSQAGLGTYVKNASRGDFAVCVKGMDFEQDMSVRMIEWIELNRILGADHFFIYVYSVHPNVMRVLRYYESLRILSVIVLNLPGKQPNFPPSRTKFLKRNVWQKRRNELIPYNDCLYRSLYRYKYILPIDIDEVPVPVNHYTWREMFEDIASTTPRMAQKYAGFSIQNAYFFDEVNLAQDNSIPAHFHMLQTVYRSSNFSKPGYSIKSFVNTTATKTVFNHYPIMLLYPHMKENTILPTSLAQMNHYKSKCPAVFYPDCKDNYLKYIVHDTITWRYMDQLVPKVNKIIYNLGIKLFSKANKTVI